VTQILKIDTQVEKKNISNQVRLSLKSQKKEFSVHSSEVLKEVEEIETPDLSRADNSFHKGTPYARGEVIHTLLGREDSTLHN